MPNPATDRPRPPVTWFARPADRWIHALPVGNGRLGAMVFGGVQRETVTLNEDSVWQRGPEDRTNPDARRHVDEVRRLLAAGQVQEAQELAEFSLFGMPNRQQSFLPLGTLELTFLGRGGRPWADYRRELDLETGVASVRYRDGAETLHREVFASTHDDVVVVRIASDAPTGVALAARLTRAWDAATERLAGHRQALVGRCGTRGSAFVAVLDVHADGGTVETVGDHVIVRGASAATLVVAAATDFRHARPLERACRDAERARARGFAALRDDHVREHARAFNRARFELHDPDAAAHAALPTDERLQRVKDGGTDLGLEALHAHFGRYLLLGSSRPGSAAANLQGVWNDSMMPAWNSKYTININLQMNYWPAEVWNLADCHEPLFDLIDRVRVSGRTVAERHYVRLPRLRRTPQRRPLGRRGVGDVGCYHPESKVPTPHIDALAAQGVRFADAHAAAAVCTPSRYALLTGRYAWRTRLQRGVISGYAPPLIEPDRPTLASLLRDAGYATACVGKWHLGMDFHARPGHDLDFARAPYTDRAFEAAIDFDARLGAGPLAVGFDHFFGTAGCPTCHAPYAFIDDDGFPVPPSEFDDDPVYTSREGMRAPGWSHRDVDVAFAEHAVAWIEQQSAGPRPFFLYLAASAPHEPCTTPLVPPFARGRSAAGPRGDLAWLYDWMVGRVLGALERSGVADRTLVVVTSDHGALPGDRVLAADGSVVLDAAGEESYRTYGHDPSGGWRGSKGHAWEGGHRVPLVVRPPEPRGTAVVDERLVSLIDLVPTIAQLAGVPLPDGAAPDGVAFGSALSPHTPVRAERDHLVLHSEAGVFGLRAGPWKLIEGTEGSGGWPPPAGGPPVPGAPGQLYDLASDPGETSNRYAERPDLVRDLGALLDAARRGDRAAR